MSAGTDAFGNDLKSQGVEVGTRVNFRGNLIGEISYNKTVGDDFNTDYDDRLTFNISYLF
jgi:hypothetical protein